MKKEVFEQKAAEMGDFYVYYTSTDPMDKSKKFAVATVDFSTKYIRDRLRKNLLLDATTEAHLWSWTHNKMISIPYTSISKLVPLSTVLQNGD